MVAVDCGIKLNIIRSLNQRGCNVTVVPYNTSAEEIRRMDPDGIFLSNGPGDPQDVKPVIQLVKELRGEYPIFGICLGHQMICLACGAKTYKLKFGHRGGNHPVKNLKTGRLEITSQNHSYAVDEKDTGGHGPDRDPCEPAGRHRGGAWKVWRTAFSPCSITRKALPALRTAYLFDQFLDMMKEAPMPKRTDIKSLVIGSGPIVIGQAAEFDYAGTQACIALQEEGYEVILVNSNPATIMTDSSMADKVYMEPLTLEYVAKIIRYERPDAILPRHRRPDGPEPGHAAGTQGHPGRVPGGTAGYFLRLHRHGRGPGEVQGTVPAHRGTGAALSNHPFYSGG